MAIAASAEEDWRLHGGSQTDQRFSPLNQVNEETVSRLGLLWSQELGTSRGLEATPGHDLLATVT
jgi:glucose dehydrogenase